MTQCGQYLVVVILKLDGVLLSKLGVSMYWGSLQHPTEYLPTVLGEARQRLHGLLQRVVQLQQEMANVLITKLSSA